MSIPSNERTVWLARHILPHEAALRAWLRSRPTGGLDIDDIVQESYAILANLKSVAQIRSPRAYFFQVAHSVVLQHVRHSRIVPIELMAEIEASGINSDENVPERLAGNREQLSRVAELLARLPHKCRQAFVMRKIDGLSQKEIASAMDISESTVEKHIGKGLKLLMGWMADPNGQTPAARNTMETATSGRKSRAKD